MRWSSGVPAGATVVRTSWPDKMRHASRCTSTCLVRAVPQGLVSAGVITGSAAASLCQGGRDRVGERCGSSRRYQIADRFGSPVCPPGETHLCGRNVDDRNRDDFGRDLNRRGYTGGNEADRPPGADYLNHLFEIADGRASSGTPAVGAWVDVVPGFPDGAGAPVQDDGVVGEFPDGDLGALREPMASGQQRHRRRRVKRVWGAITQTSA